MYEFKIGDKVRLHSVTGIPGTVIGTAVTVSDGGELSSFFIVDIGDPRLVEGGGLAVSKIVAHETAMFYDGKLKDGGAYATHQAG